MPVTRGDGLSPVSLMFAFTVVCSRKLRYSSCLSYLPSSAADPCSGSPSWHFLIATEVRVQHHSPRKRLCLVLGGVPLVQFVPLWENLSLSLLTLKVDLKLQRHNITCKPAYDMRIARHGMAWHGMKLARHMRIARHGMAWHGMAWHEVGKA